MKNKNILPAILLAPNAFKGSLTAFEVCRILAKEFQSHGFQTFSLPLGDGGDDTAQIISHYLGAKSVDFECIDALGRPRPTRFYHNHDTAIIELAETCGIKHLKKDEYDILNANTAGFGQTIIQALEKGFRKLILCIGGSASIDGGLGALVSMGLNVKCSSDRYRNHLIDLQHFNSDYIKDRFRHIDCTILCDVNNPICGPQGAATVFGPQKGASPQHVLLLDQALHNFTTQLELATGKKLVDLPRGGAAGGIALSLHALLDAKLISGAEYCLSLSQFKNYLSQCFAVITGEGKIDEQSLYGKIPGTIAKWCRTQHIPLYAVAGIVHPSCKEWFEQTYAFMDYASSIEESILYAKEYLKCATYSLVQTIIDKYYSESFSFNE